MKILAIDSSAVSASAALVNDGKITGEFFLNIGLTHSRTLMPLTASLLSCAGQTLNDIDILAVTIGPGSFTGVRIGVATIKGMAAPTDKKCVGVSTLHAMAYNLADKDGIICCTMDARCNQVYTALFRSSSGKIERITDDDALSIDDLGESLRQYSEKVTFVGDGAALCYDKLSRVLDNVFLAPENVRYQRAGGAALAVYNEKLFANPVKADELNVTYLRLSQAERELKSKKEKSE